MADYNTPSSETPSKEPASISDNIFGKAICWIETTIDPKITPIQNLFEKIQIQKVCDLLKEVFYPLETTCSAFFEDLGKGKWHEKLATFLWKLPLKALYNIAYLLYAVIKEILYFLAHPLQALSDLAKTILRLLSEFTKPEIWIKMGAGIVGGSLGQALVTGNPLSIIAVGIGAAMAFVGLTAGVLKTAIQTEQRKAQAATTYALSQMKNVLESLLSRP